MAKEIEYRVITISEDRQVALGKKDSDDYVVQFLRPLYEKENSENIETSTVEVKDGKVVTAILLSSAALKALVSLYIENKEKEGYEIMLDVRLVKKEELKDED